MISPTMISAQLAVFPAGEERTRITELLRDFGLVSPYETGMPGDTGVLERWNTLPLEAKRVLSPLVENEEIDICDGTVLSQYSENDENVLRSRSELHVTKRRDGQRVTLFVDCPPSKVITYLICASPELGLAGREEEVDYLLSLIEREASRDAQAAFSRGFPASFLLLETLIEERGHVVLAQFAERPPAFLDAWQEAYPYLFAFHYASLTGSGGDDLDYLNDDTLWLFREEELNTYTHNVYCAAVAADYRAWCEGEAQRYYYHPNSPFLQERGNFGFLALIGDEGWAEIQKGQTKTDLPLGHQAMLWRGDALLERFALAQGPRIRSTDYETHVPVLRISGPHSHPEMINLERAHQYFARRYPDPSRRWTVVPMWAGLFYDDPGDFHVGGYEIIPTWLTARERGSA